MVLCVVDIFEIGFNEELEIFGLTEFCSNGIAKPFSCE